jgi:hypothetical protein
MLHSATICARERLHFLQSEQKNGTTPRADGGCHSSITVQHSKQTETSLLSIAISKDCKRNCEFAMIGRDPKGGITRHFLGIVMIRP